MPLQVVSVVRKAKLLTKERTEQVLFLCQADAQSAVVWRFAKRAVEFETVHISAIRANKVNLFAIEAFLKPVLDLNALSLTARPILPHERKTHAWTTAIKTHAEKLMSLKFAEKAVTNPPDDAVRSFFVGRNVDGNLTARLVANGGLSLDGQTLDQYLPTTSERFSFLTLFTHAVHNGAVPWSGDISGAYYATKGSGYIRLPHDWPRGVGGFNPHEIVSLLCAIPGDRLSSGLFLHQLDQLLTSNGCSIVSGRIKQFKHSSGNVSWFINYSDDLLGFSPTLKDVREIEAIINKRFKVTLDEGVPPKWVGVDMAWVDGQLHVSSASTFLSYDLPYSRFSLNSLSTLQLTTKTEDDKAKKHGLSMIGKLLFGAVVNPWLTYLSSFLASAVHYDPLKAAQIASSAIAYYAKHPVGLRFGPFKPTHIAVYTDASHSRLTHRAHAGSWVQLQRSDQPEERQNPVCWGSERLRK